MKRALATLVVVGSVGCYAYVPPPNGGPATGNPIQLALTDSGAVVLTPLIGPSIATLEGQLVADSAATYVLSVSKTSRRDGSEMDWRGERVAVPHVLVSSVGTRRFSRGRTLLLSALTTGVLLGISQAFVGGGGATVPGGTPGGPGSGK